MCAPDALNRQFNPTGDNPSTVCDLCQGTTGNTFCTNQDPYAGNIGALMCLFNRGDIAFVRHTALIELQNRDPTFPIDQFQLLCINGQRVPWQQFQQCNWVNNFNTKKKKRKFLLFNLKKGIAPASAVVVSHRRPKQLRDIYRKVLIDSARFFSAQNPQFQLFNSQRFQSNDLLFSDATIDFNLLDDRTSYTNYLGKCHICY